MTDDPGLLLTIALAGGVGSLLRVEWSEVARRRWPDQPWGTRSVNVLGAVALAVLLTGDAPMSVGRVVGLGLLGGFTTFSTWMLESDLSAGGRLREVTIQLAPALALVLAILP